MILVSVDFPAPLGLSSAITAPLGIVRFTPRRTSIRPYAACTSTTSRIGTLIFWGPLGSVNRTREAPLASGFVGCSWPDRRDLRGDLNGRDVGEGLLGQARSRRDADELTLGHL